MTPIYLYKYDTKCSKKTVTVIANSALFQMEV